MIEVTEGFTLSVDGGEAEEAGEAGEAEEVQYVKFSESIDQPNDDGLYATIETAINSVLTKDGFYSQISSALDESERESLAAPISGEPAVEIPVKTGFYVPISGYLTAPFGPIEYNTSEGTIIVQGVSLLRPLLISL